MKCNKVKNPCKICFQSVTKKTGLQCQGACQKWAHYKCLNYTPGKIQDIKAGIIKIFCPCPDCTTTEPKEVLTDPPFSCTNTKCPANALAPACESAECPSKTNPIPTYRPPTSGRSSESSPICTPCPQLSPPETDITKCPSPIPRCEKRLSQTSQTQPKFPTTPPKYGRNSSPKSGCPNPVNCPAKCKHVCPPTCTSNKNGTSCCSPKQSQSYSGLSNNSNRSEKQEKKIRTISSESELHNLGVDQATLFKAIEGMCSTVGQLSNQLKDLMCKLCK